MGEMHLIGQEYPMPPSNCPTCDTSFTSVTPLANQPAPRPGSATLCANCAEVLVFTDALTVRLPHREEMLGWSLEMRTRIGHARGAIREMIALQGKDGRMNG